MFVSMWRFIVWVCHCVWFFVSLCAIICDIASACASLCLFVIIGERVFHCVYFNVFLRHRVCVPFCRQMCRCVYVFLTVFHCFSLCMWICVVSILIETVCLYIVVYMSFFLFSIQYYASLKICVALCVLIVNFCQSFALVI